MKQEKKYQVSVGELDILQILWAHQPTTVKDIHEQLQTQGKEVGYTTILKQMQRMTNDKKLLKRSKKGKVHFYRAVPKNEDEVQLTMFQKLVDSAFEGSAMKLALHALGNSKANSDEIEALQKWLDEQKKKL